MHKLELNRIKTSILQMLPASVQELKTHLESTNNNVNGILQHHKLKGRVYRTTEQIPNKSGTTGPHSGCIWMRTPECDEALGMQRGERRGWE